MSQNDNVTTIPGPESVFSAVPPRQQNVLDKFIASATSPANERPKSSCTTPMPSHVSVAAPPTIYTPPFPPPGSSPRRSLLGPLPLLSRQPNGGYANLLEQVSKQYEEMHKKEMEIQGQLVKQSRDELLQNIYSEGVSDQLFLNLVSYGFYEELKQWLTPTVWADLRDGRCEMIGLAPIRPCGWSLLSPFLVAKRRPEFLIRHPSFSSPIDQREAVQAALSSYNQELNTIIMKILALLRHLDYIKPGASQNIVKIYQAQRQNAGHYNDHIPIICPTRGSLHYGIGPAVGVTTPVTDVPVPQLLVRYVNLATMPGPVSQKPPSPHPQALERFDVAHKKFSDDIQDSIQKYKGLIPRQPAVHQEEHEGHVQEVQHEPGVEGVAHQHHRGDDDGSLPVITHHAGGPGLEHSHLPHVTHALDLSLSLASPLTQVPQLDGGADSDVEHEDGEDDHELQDPGAGVEVEAEANMDNFDGLCSNDSSLNISAIESLQPLPSFSSFTKMSKETPSSSQNLNVSSHSQFSHISIDAQLASLQSPQSQVSIKRPHSPEAYPSGSLPNKMLCQDWTKTSWYNNLTYFNSNWSYPMFSSTPAPTDLLTINTNYGHPVYSYKNSAGTQGRGLLATASLASSTVSTSTSSVMSTMAPHTATSSQPINWSANFIPCNKDHDHAANKHEAEAFVDGEEARNEEDKNSCEDGAELEFEDPHKDPSQPNTKYHHVMHASVLPEVVELSFQEKKSHLTDKYNQIMSSKLSISNKCNLPLPNSNYMILNTSLPAYH